MSVYAVCTGSVALIAIIYMVVPPYVLACLVVAFLAAYLLLVRWLRGTIVQTSEISGDGIHAPREEFDKRRARSNYPPIVSNTWYALAYSDDVSASSSTPLHVRAIGQVESGASFSVWRTSGGKLVVQSAFCPHQGANMAVGGKLHRPGANKSAGGANVGGGAEDADDDECVECPFHRWRFDAQGRVRHIPAAKTQPVVSCPSSSSPPSVSRKLKVFPSQDWCGMAMVYFHADQVEGDSPEFALPPHVEAQLLSSDSGEAWRPFVRLNLGRVTLSPVDWVDQATDHSHFYELHSQVLIPWTTKPLPGWLSRRLPLNVKHVLKTYGADSAEWYETFSSYVSAKSGLPLACAGDPHLMFFTDDVVVRSGEVELEKTRSSTLEMYVGPALMVFHIPFDVGHLKVVVCTTPLEGHSSVMRVNTWVEDGGGSWFARFLVRGVAWVVAGVAASQLAADASIQSNRARLKKPLRQFHDGPGQGKASQWLKQFYSENSANVGKDPFCVDWQ